jgi:hypothetical protein
VEVASCLPVVSETGYWNWLADERREDYCVRQQESQVHNRATVLLGGVRVGRYYEYGRWF